MLLVFITFFLYPTIYYYQEYYPDGFKKFRIIKDAKTNLGHSNSNVKIIYKKKLKKRNQLHLFTNLLKMFKNGIRYITWKYGVVVIYKLKNFSNTNSVIL